MKTCPSILFLILGSIGLNAQNVGIGTITPTSKAHIEGDTNLTETVLTANVNYSGTEDVIAIEGNSLAAPGWGYGGILTGGYMGLLAWGNAGDYTGNAYGVFGQSTGTTGRRIGIYGIAAGGTENWAGYFDGRGYFMDSVAIGVLNPIERLDIAGAIRLGTSSSNNAGTIRYLNGLFQGNTTGTSSGWKSFTSPWVEGMSGNYFLSPISGGGQVAIGDSLFQSSSKFSVRQEIVLGGGGIHGLATKNGLTVAEGQLGYQYGSFAPLVVANFGVLGTVYHDSIISNESFGVAGNNWERDSCNYGVYGVAQGFGIKNVGVYGFAQNGLSNWAGFFDGSGYVRDSVGIGVVSPQEKLDVAGAIKLGSSSGNNAGSFRYLNGLFQGNTTGTASGWKTFNGPWVKNSNNNYFLSPFSGNVGVAIGDSVIPTPSSLYVQRELVTGGIGIHSKAVQSGTTVAEAFLGYQASILGLIISNFGILGTVYNDSTVQHESFGVAGQNIEEDSCNYGVYGISQGHGIKNIGVYGFAQNGVKNWAAYLDGNTHVSEKLLVGTEDSDPEAKMHIMVPSSGNFPHLRIESPDSINGFGITFKNSAKEFLIGQNIGNWNDGRFSIFSGSSLNGLTMLQNGDIALTRFPFLTPFARFQVPQKGSLNNADTLEVTNAAIFIGEVQSQGMAFDENQIESVGDKLNLNFNSSYDINMADGGGNVGVDVGIARAKFHVGDGRTVLFGKDTIGDGNIASKLMWLPAQGGAFRVGHLRYDGSVGNGTTFWDPENIGWSSIAIGNNNRATGDASTAIGIRCDAANFGAVAIGHLARTRGNSAFAAGYYTRADAFLVAAVGAGNVGGGNNNIWIATDPIFEVGNTVDTANRHNALTILKNGKVGIETHSPSASLHIKQLSSSADGGIRLEYDTDTDYWETWIDGANDYNFAYNGTLKGYIQDTDGAYIISSDRRLKTNVQVIDPVLSNVRKLNPSTYQYIANTPESPRSVGFIAQEVEELFPELVTGKDGYLGVNYSAFAVIAIQAIKELADKNDTLNNQVQDYQNDISELEERINEMQLQINRILEEN